jgi:glycosyltransferase involved in cell wall biosynthesis
MERLKVAIVAPPYYELPPKDYGGTELVCFVLAEGLVDRGHEVTVFGVGARHTRAGFHATFDEPQAEGEATAVRIELLHAASAAQGLAALDVDVVHDHSRLGPLTAPSRSAPTVLTVHSALGGADSNLPEVHAVAPWVNLVAVSAAQRADAPHLSWAGVVHNGIDVGRYPLATDKASFVLFLGRLSQHKGVETAIAAARTTGQRLVIAGSWTTPAEHDFFNSRVRPLLGPDVDWVGPVGFEDKVALLGQAACLLVPGQWHEPFGLVMIEAMACGTPVVALRRGAVPELVKNGVTGLVCDSDEELPAALGRVGLINAADCRTHVEVNFSMAKMVRRYEERYLSVIRSR